MKKKKIDKIVNKIFKFIMKNNRKFHLQEMMKKIWMKVQTYNK